MEVDDKEEIKEEVLDDSEPKTDQPDKSELSDESVADPELEETEPEESEPVDEAVPYASSTQYTYDHLPSGCNVFYGTYIDNYNGSTRVRYYLNDYNLIPSSSVGNANRPAGSICLSNNLNYKPEVEVYFKAISFALIAFAGVLLFNIVIKRLWQGK